MKCKSKGLNRFKALGLCFATALGAATPSAGWAAVELLQDFTVVADGVTRDVPGVSVAKVLAAGKSLYIYAKGTASSSSSGNVMMGLSVSCGPAGIWSTRNHEGSDYYPATGGNLTLAVRYLFTAPTAGTYECKLKARSKPGAGADSSDNLTLLPGSSNTLISVVAAAAGSTAWGTENDYKDKYYDPAASDEAVHLGPGLAAGTEEYALRTSRWLGSADEVTAVGDIEMTVCYDHTGSCPSYAWGALAIKDAGSTVDTRLLVQQMPDATSSTPCAVAYDPPTGYRRTVIHSAAHHQKIYHQISNLPLNPACGSSRYFIDKVEVKWVSGNPVRIEPSNYSTNILLNEP